MGGIRLSKPSVVIHDYQYVLVSTRARFEMNIIHRNELERHCGKDWLKRSINVSWRFSLFQAMAYFGDIVGDVCSHKRPIEAFSS